MPEKKTNSVDFGYLGDKKVEKGAGELLEKSAKWRGPSNKERHEEREQQRDTKKILKAVAARQTEKASWRKRVGGICAILFLCGVGLFQFISTIMGFMMGTGITTLDVADTTALKTVLFDGNPWLVYCVNNQTVSHRLPRVLEDNARALSSSLGVRTAVLSCWDATASGRSVAERFSLPKKAPMSFVVANGNKPKLINLVGVSKIEDLEKTIKPMIEVGVHRIDTLKKWPSLCTSRRACVVIGHRQGAQKDAALSVFRPLLESNRGVKVVTLDTSFWQLKLEDALLATRPGAKGKDAARGADVVCLARKDSSAASEGNATNGGLFLQQLDGGSAATFLKACAQQAGLVPLSSAPRINARPSKPKKVTPAAPPAPRPPAPAPKPKQKRSNVDHVGSRAQLEQEEALFEAVEEEEASGGGEEGDEEEVEEEGGDDDEVEL